MLTFPNTLGVIFGAGMMSLLALGTNRNTGIPACPVERASLPVLSSGHPCLLVKLAGWEACTTCQA
jgi:hypothetical protein